jgi:hypothetical protein
MKDPAYSIRKAYYDALLNGNIQINGAGVSIYDNIPNDADYPYIQVSNVSLTDESTKNNFNSNAIVTIQIFTGTDGNSFYKKDCDVLSNTVMGLVLNRSSRLDASPDFKIVTAILENATYLETQYDGFYEVRKIIRIRNIVEQL